MAQLRHDAPGVSGVAQTDDLVARLDNGGGVHLQTAVAAEDGHDACGNLRQMREEFTDRAAHQRTARLGAHGDEACKPFSEFLNLNGFGKVNELDEIAHERLLGPDDGRCFKAFLAQNAGIVSKLVVADAGDAGRNVEDAGAEHRYDEVRLVARGDGDQHVRIGRACIGQHLRAGGVAHDAAQVESRLQGSDALGVLVNDGDVVGFGDQTLGDRAADAACAHNQDFHESSEPLFTSVVF